MKKIVSKYKEAFALTLNRDAGRLRVNQKATVMIHPNESIIIKDEEVSPEILRLHKKGYVELSDYAEEPKAVVVEKVENVKVSKVNKKSKEITEPQINPGKESKPVIESVKKNDEPTSEELKKLEQELLK